MRRARSAASLLQHFGIRMISTWRGVVIAATVVSFPLVHNAIAIDGGGSMFAIVIHASVKSLGLAVGTQAVALF